MLIFKIAFRNIFRQKRRSILTALTIFGGFTLAAISIGWSDGTYNFIIDMFTRNQLGHIQIHAAGYREKPSLYKTINDLAAIKKKLDGIERVEAYTPRLFSAGLVSVGDQSAGVQITGIDPIQENKATRFSKKIINGSDFSMVPSHEVIIGKGLAKILDANLHDEVVIVSQAADGSIANDLYKIVGIIETGNDISDRIAFYLHLEDAQELLVLENRIHEIAIIAEDLDIVDQLTSTLKKEFENTGMEVVPWQVFAKSFYVAMKADQEGMWIMLFIIILIVAVGVLNTVLMTVLERQREYGLLKAIGTKPFQVFQLIMYEVNLLTCFSIIVGAILGTLINYLLSINGISLPQPFTYGGIEFKTMYTEVNARSLIIPAITVFLTAFVVGFFPAIKAVRTEPAKAMRMH
jgi:putative ABC transport system permease protein